MKTADFLRQHDAYLDVAKWALSISDDMPDVWNAMIEQGKHGWLLWTMTRPGVFSDTVLRKLACRLVRETPLHDGRTVWDLLTDERSRKAVEVAERYVDGKATKKELADAADAAWAAYSAAWTTEAADHTARAAAWAAAWAASWAASWAANVAAHTVYAAASYAADAAASYASRRRRRCRRCRPSPHDCRTWQPF